MGVVLARCTRCDRLLKVVVYQAKGRRLRNQRSPCCKKRMRRHTYPREAVERRPEIIAPRLPL
jgi:exosome complex RNA-binding protein Csl4